MHMRQRGGSLVEVLVAVLILALGLLGVVAVQSAALRHAGGSLELTQAAIHGQSMLESMRSNRPGVLAGAYNTGGFACTPPAGTSRASGDVRRWLDSLQQAIGASACGQIACSAAACRVAVRWDARWADADAPPQELAIRAQL